jgi:hypothetical protein
MDRGLLMDSPNCWGLAVFAAAAEAEDDDDDKGYEWAFILFP